MKIIAASPIVVAVPFSLLAACIVKRTAGRAPAVLNNINVFEELKSYMRLNNAYAGAENVFNDIHRLIVNGMYRIKNADQVLCRIPGRLCYLFMCIEKYLITCYPEREWGLVAERCWQWANVYWNEGCDIYSAVVPEYLFEFDNYEKKNILVFEGKLSKKDYSELTDLFAGLTTGNSEDEINQVLILPIEFNNECECTGFDHANNPTLKILSKVRAGNWLEFYRRYS